jgi:hypothetical protein
MGHIFDGLDVVVGKVEDLEVGEGLQAFYFEDFVVVEFEFDQVGEALQSLHRMGGTLDHLNQVVAQEEGP